MKMDKSRGNHLPVLIRLMEVTDGPVLELGMGIFSTPFLHWFCSLTKRRLVSCENNPKYFEWAKEYQSDFHTIICGEYDKLDLSEHWNVAFVDLCPDNFRIDYARKLAHADYLVIHDTEDSEDRKRISKGYEPISNLNKLFVYSWKHRVEKINTTIFSNFNEVRGFDSIMSRPFVDVPPSVDKIRLVPESEMNRTHSQPNRRYTICRSLRDIFIQTNDPYVRTRLQYASALAEIMTQKISKHDIMWLRKLYPKRIDFQRIVDNSVKEGIK